MDYKANAKAEMTLGSLSNAMEVIKELAEENAALKEQLSAFGNLPPTLSIKYVEEYLGISKTMAYDLLRRKPEAGGIGDYRVGNKWLASRESFERWLESKQTG